MCHVIGDEKEATLRNGFTETYDQLKKLDRHPMSVQIPNSVEPLHIQLTTVHVMDFKCMYLCAGHLGWAANGYFSVLCKCLMKKGGVSSCACELTTNEEYQRLVQHAREKFELCTLEEYEKWIRQENYGVRHNGALVDVIDMDYLYVDTFHTKSNMTVSFAMAFMKYLCLMEDHDDESLTKGWLDIVSTLGFDVYTIEDYSEMKRPGLLGNDCSAFRKAFFGNQKENHWKTIENLGDMIIESNGEVSVHALLAHMHGPLSMYLVDNLEIIDGSFIANLIISWVLFLTIYEEMTSLETNDDRICRVTVLSSTFSKYAALSVFESFTEKDGEPTMYGHVIGSLIPKLIKRFYQQSGKGYGYLSMQSVEHVNKQCKRWYSTRTNFQTNKENYDAIASLLYLSKNRMLEYDFHGKTKGEIQHLVKKEQYG